MTTKLPNIDIRDSLNADELPKKNSASKTLIERVENQEYVSPFRLPSDDEIFVYRELERKKKDEMKQLTQSLKVCDKKTGTSRKALHLFKDFEMEVKEGLQLTSKGYTFKDKSLIMEAQRIIIERRKDREIGGKEQKEGIVDLLEQKKEMFLVEMTAGIIEREREALIYKAAEKEQALKKSDEMLEKDWTEFELYKQNNKQETDNVVERYNKEAESKKETEKTYKTKNNELTSLKAEKTKNEEFVERYLDAKNFLQKLTPKEFLDQREEELRVKIEEIKAQYMEREHMNNKDDSQSTISEGVVKAPKDKKAAGKKTVKNDVEKAFADKLEKGEFDEIEQYKWNQEMYFKDPEELMKMFLRLEEANVSLIQGMQDTEQNLENLKNILKAKKSEFDQRISGLREHKFQLEKNKTEKEQKIKALQLKAKEPSLEKGTDELIPFRKKVIEVVRMLKEDTKGNADLEALSTLELLAFVEIHLDKQLAKLTGYKASRVVELKREVEDARKRLNRKVQMEEEQNLADEKSRKASERVHEKVKRKGRTDMTKSTPLEKKEAVVEVVKNTEEEEDMKYFKPYLTKF